MGIWSAWRLLLTLQKWGGDSIVLGDPMILGNDPIILHNDLESPCDPFKRKLHNSCLWTSRPTACVQQQLPKFQHLHPWSLLLTRIKHGLMTHHYTGGYDHPVLKGQKEASGCSSSGWFVWQGMRNGMTPTNNPTSGIPVY